MPSLDLRFKILDDPDRRIRNLKQGMRNRILRKAVRAGAGPIRQAARAGAPKGATGALGASISVRIATSRRTGAIYAVVGPRRKYVRKKRGKVLSEGAPTKIAHLVEGGTRPHIVGSRGGRHPGARANPFLRRAWQSESAAAVERMRAVIEQELARMGGGTDSGE